MFHQVSSQSYQPITHSIGLHYDIYPTDKEDKELNVIMFEIIILGSISDSNGNPFYLPENLKFYIEIS